MNTSHPCPWLPFRHAEESAACNPSYFHGDAKLPVCQFSKLTNPNLLNHFCFLNECDLFFTNNAYKSEYAAKNIQSQIIRIAYKRYIIYNDCLYTNVFTLEPNLKMVNSAEATVEQSIKAYDKQEITVGTQLLFLWSITVETSSEGLEVIKPRPLSKLDKRR